MSQSMCPPNISQVAIIYLVAIWGLTMGNLLKWDKGEDYDKQVLYNLSSCLLLLMWRCGLNRNPRFSCFCLLRAGLQAGTVTLPSCFVWGQDLTTLLSVAWNSLCGLNWPQIILDPVWACECWGFWHEPPGPVFHFYFLQQVNGTIQPNLNTDGFSSFMWYQKKKKKWKFPIYLSCKLQLWIID